MFCYEHMLNISVGMLQNFLKNKVTYYLESFKKLSYQFDISICDPYIREFHYTRFYRDYNNIKVIPVH